MTGTSHHRSPATRLRIPRRTMADLHVPGSFELPGTAAASPPPGSAGSREYEFEMVDRWFQEGAISTDETVAHLKSQAALWDSNPRSVLDRLVQAAEFYKSGHCYLSGSYGQKKSSADIEPFLKWTRHHRWAIMKSWTTYGMREMLLDCEAYTTAPKGHPRNILCVPVSEMTAMLQARHGREFDRVLDETMRRRLADPGRPMPKANYQPSGAALAMRNMRARRALGTGSSPG